MVNLVACSDTKVLCAKPQCSKPARPKSKFCAQHKDKQTSRSVKECYVCHQGIDRKSFARHLQKCVSRGQREIHLAAPESGKRQAKFPEDLPAAKRENVAQAALPTPSTLPSTKRVCEESDRQVSAPVHKKVNGGRAPSDVLPEDLQRFLDDLTRKGASDKHMFIC